MYQLQTYIINKNIKYNLAMYQLQTYTINFIKAQQIRLVL